LKPEEIEPTEWLGKIAPVSSSAREEQAEPGRQGVPRERTWERGP